MVVDVDDRSLLEDEVDAVEWMDEVDGCFLMGDETSWPGSTRSELYSSPHEVKSANEILIQSIQGARSHSARLLMELM